MNDKLKKVMSLFARKSVPYKVSGFPQELSFYPVSTTMLYDMQTVFNPLLEALRAMWLRQSDVSRVNQTEQQIDEEGRPSGVTIVNQTSAIDPELAAQRAVESKDAFDTISKEIFSQDNKLTFARLISDSLRDLFPRDSSDEEKLEFFDMLDTLALVDLARGFLKANMKVLGPFAKRIQDKFQSVMDSALSEASEQLSQETPVKQDEESEELSLNPTLPE